MRREMRNSQNDDNLDTKKILYITGAIFVLAIIIFGIVFWLYSKQWDEDYKQIGQINSITEGYEEETSSSFGKSVNEAKNGISTNSVDKMAVNTSELEKERDKNKTSSNNTNSAGNTSSGKSSTKTKNTTSNTTETSNANKSTNSKKEEVKTPVFKRPVEGEIIKKFANTNLVYSNTLGEWIVHNGIDIKAEKTTVVKASEEGKVKSIKNDPRYGLTIVIEHSSEYSTVYSNLLSAEFVVVGETVTQGQTIGTVGNTATFEIADEPHLHFEILHKTEQLDPELYLK